MDKYNKSLLCMYVDDFCGIKEESFNFYIERRYTIRKGKISRKRDEEIIDFPTDFWGDNVSAVTLLIGENGAGKTTLMRLLIKWLCQLSAGHIPQERGALVISVEGEDMLIAFDGGEPWKIGINRNEKIVRIENKDEIKKLLSDIRLAYYTDTMTDLELSDTLTAEELAFLKDDSLLNRLSSSMKNRYIVDSIKECVKREDFKRQMKLFLYSKEKAGSIQGLPIFLQEFPIRYMKFTSIQAGNEKSFKRIPDCNNGLIGEAIDFWNMVFANNTNDNMPVIGRGLLWGIFSGTIISLLEWERTLPNLQNSIVTKQIRSSLRAFIRTNNNDWNIVFKRFFSNMFSDCERGFNDVHRCQEFRTVWDKQQVEHRISSFLDVLKSIENGAFLKKWMPFENTQNIWEFKLDYFNEKDKNEAPILIQDWKCLWEHYLTVAHLMPECRFDWKYASSGGKNKSNLYTNLFDVVDKCSNKGINQLWILLDEPDNTFHPDWERRIIQNLLEICSIFDTNFQLLISTHSPIMLSDVPKQAAVLLKTSEKKGNGDKTEKKQQRYPESSPFGQQIYTLFNDAFFMEQGIIGAFADMKIGEVYNELYRIEERISKREKIWEKDKLDDLERDLKKCEIIIKLVEEPLLHGHLSQSYKLCGRRIKES